MDASRLIFLGGSPRSGTTLVQNIVDSHPDILGGPEFLHLQDIVALRKKMQISVSKEWITLFCDEAAVDQHIKTLIEQLLLPFADREGAKYLSEKTPENVLVFPELAAMFPESKFVFVVRDPRATVASMLQVAKRAREKGEQPAHFTRSASASVQYVKQCLRAGFSAAEKFPENVYTVVYESLVKDPEGQTRALAEFLGCGFSEEMLRPGEQKHLGEAAITTNSQDIWYDKETYYSNPNTASIDKWRDQLSIAEQLVVFETFGKFQPLINMGYEFERPETSGASGFAAQLQRQGLRIKDRGLHHLRKIVGA